MQELVSINSHNRTLIDAINRSHAECVGCDDDIKSALLRKVNKAREVGLWLDELRRGTRHGDWTRLFATADGKANRESVLGFDVSSARNYIRFAIANPDPFTDLPSAIRSLKDAMIASGALPSPARTEQQNARGDNFYGGLITFAGRVVAHVNRWRESHQIHELSNAERRDIKAQLEPIVKVYELL